MKSLLLCLLGFLIALPASAQDCPPGTVFTDGSCRSFQRDDAIRERAEAAEAARAAAPMFHLPAAAGSSLFGAGGPAGVYVHSNHILTSGKLNLTLIPVRAYLASKDIPPAQIGAYGMVVMRSLPTDASADRLQMMCRSFVSTLARQGDLSSAIGPEQQMLTIWPLRHPTAPLALSDDCATVLKDYDITAGDLAVRDASRQGASFSGRGPYLVGWSPSTSRSDPDKLVLVIDMSGASSPEAFDHYFLFWKEKVIEDPSLWQNGFTAEKVKDAIRNFADARGEQMLEAIKVIGLK